mmetsp:Transcript_118649/g.340640  ORF Transcript_118649/g.340640 Transcript_118649/m.340640 type:complete len:341 (+) Transcript_118649:79-1101(+)
MAEASGAAKGQRVLVFVFPTAPGHINPSLAMARALIAQGHVVHYVCREPLRGAIESTGAVFHEDTEVERELYDGREADAMGAVDALKRERGLEGENIMEAFPKVVAIQAELMLPGLTRWFREIGACAAVYCPILCAEAGFAAKAVGLPSVALLTTAGPGSMPRSWSELMAMCGTSEERVCKAATAPTPRPFGRSAIRVAVAERSALRPHGRPAAQHRDVGHNVRGSPGPGFRGRRPSARSRARGQSGGPLRRPGEHGHNPHWRRPRRRLGEPGHRRGWAAPRLDLPRVVSRGVGGVVRRLRQGACRGRPVVGSRPRPAEGAVGGAAAAGEHGVRPRRGRS